MRARDGGLGDDFSCLWGVGGRGWRKEETATRPGPRSHVVSALAEGCDQDQCKISRIFSPFSYLFWKVILRKEKVIVSISLPDGGMPPARERSSWVTFKGITMQAGLILLKFTVLCFADIAFHRRGQTLH